MRSLIQSLLWAFALSVLLDFAPVAYAEEGRETQEEAMRSESSTLSFSPLHLIAPVIELTYESTLGAHLGTPMSFALIGGAGTIRVEDVVISVFELGLQLRGYPNDPFEGLHYGLELSYLGLSADAPATISGGAAGLATGLFLGWKAILDSGFTFDLQAGYQVLFTSAEASDSESGEREEMTGIDGGLLVNLNIGWSF